MCWMALLSVAVSAQDFASRFLTEHKADSNLTCITISPKMMEEIMKSDAEKDDEVLEIISNLKSMILIPMIMVALNKAKIVPFKKNEHVRQNV